VIAFEQYLAASAGTHHAMAQVFEARGIVSGAHEHNYGDGERGGLQAAAGANPELRWPPTTAKLRSAWTGEGARPYTRH
jgi:hypothetical protein